MVQIGVVQQHKHIVATERFMQDYGMEQTLVEQQQETLQI